MTVGVVDQFVLRISRSFRVRRVVSEFTRGSIAAGLCLVSVHIVAPTWFWPALASFVGLLGSCAGLRYWLLRVDPGDADAGLRLRGGLRTWVEVGRDHQDRAVASWFERELGARIDALPDADLRALGRRGLGPARHALLLLLIVLFLKSLFLPPMPEGQLELAGMEAGQGASDARSPQSGAGQDAEQDAASVGGKTEEAPEPEPSPPDDPVPPPDPSGSDAPPPDAPPEALLEDLPVQDDFVVPAFVGAGEGITKSTPVVGLDEAPAGSAAAGTTGRDGEAAPSPPSAEPPPDFRRAVESALQSRHVRDDERPFVRLWFRSLLDEHR